MHKRIFIKMAVCLLVVLPVISCVSCRAPSSEIDISNIPDRPSPTPPPTELPTPAHSPYYLDGQIEEGEPVEASYFDDAVFIGDSITQMLRQYAAATGDLGQAQFLCSGSFSARNALMPVSGDSVHPAYNGVKMLLEESVPLTKAKKVYIMLGMNDIAREGGKEQALTAFEQMCDVILDNAPDVTLYVQSVTPRANMGDTALGDLNNENISAYNEMLCDLCQQRGWYFINIAEAMFDESGYLNKDFCGDPQALGMHFNTSGCRKWVDYLYTHTS